MKRREKREEEAQKEEAEEEEVEEGGKGIISHTARKLASRPACTSVGITTRPDSQASARQHSDTVAQFSFFSPSLPFRQLE